MKNAAKVGLVTLVGIVLLITLLFWKSGIASHIQGFEIVGSFQNTNGLLEGAEVRYRGFRIGTVSKISPRAKDILVRVRVSKKIEIPAESILRVEFDGLIGEKFIGVIPGDEPSHLYKQGDVLKGISSAGIVDFVDIGTQNLDETKKILAMLYKMLEDGQVQDSVRNILSNVEVTTSELNKLIPSLQTIAINLNQLTKSITPVLGDSGVHQDLRETIANIKRFSIELSDFFDGEMSSNVDELINSARETADALNTILQDSELKEDMKTTLRSTRKMMDRLSSFGLTDIRGLAGLDYYTETKKWGYRAGLLLGPEDNYWLLQLKSIQDPYITDIQKGILLTDWWGVHGGMINQKPGVGIDLKPWQPLKLSASFYDLDTVETELRADIRLHDSVRLIGEATDLMRQNQQYSLGIRINN